MAQSANYDRKCQGGATRLKLSFSYLKINIFETHIMILISFLKCYLKNTP